MDKSTMNPDLLKRLRVNGIDSLPWERTGIQSEEQWEAATGCVKLQAVARDDEDEPYGCKILTLEEGFWEHTGGKALGWDDAPYHAFVDELEEKFWPAYRMHEAKQRNLPRLAHLPDDLRAVAVEFLDLHGAWDTEFEVVYHEDCNPWIIWRNGKDFADFKWDVLVSNKLGRGVWEVFWHTDPDPWAGKHHVWGRMPNLRRSHDFAEFVRRFAE